MDGVPTASPDTEQTAVPRIEWIEPQQSFATFCRESTARIWKTQGGHVFSALAEGRRRLYNCVRIDNKPLTWTGTAGELTLAFVTFLGMFSAILAALISIKFFYVAQPTMTSFKYARFGLTLPALYMLGVLVWRRLEGDLEHTRWGDTPFSLRGSPWRYAWLHFWTAFLVPLTLGWIIPWRTHSLHTLKIAGISHGNRRLSYSPFNRDIYVKFAIAWSGIIAIYLITTVALGLTVGPAIMTAVNEGHWAPLLVPGTAVMGTAILSTGLLACLVMATWYRTFAFAHHISAIRIGDAELKLRLPTGEFVRMVLGNVAIKLGSLGLWSAFANARLVRLIITHLEVHHVNQSKVQLSNQSSTADLMTTYPTAVSASGG